MAKSRREFSIKIDNQTLDNIMENITEQELYEIDNILEKERLQLKLIATKFLKVAKKSEERIRRIEMMMDHQKKLRNEIRSKLGVTGRFISEYETDEYRLNREEIKNDLKNKEIENFYQAAFTFHEEINAILGKNIQTIIVLEDEKQNPIVYSVSQEDLFKNEMISFGETSKTARLNARFNVSVEQMKKAGLAALQRDNFNDNLDIENLNEAYKNIIYRYDKYKRLVMWIYPNNPKTWNKSKITSKGDIAEAYAMFFLKKAQYNFNSKNKEENIHYFMTLGVSKVDNVSGLLQGDVSTEKYDYAIKSAGASYMSVIQIVALAEKIIKKNYSISNLKEEKDKLEKKKQKSRNKIESFIEDKTLIEFDEIIKEIENLTN